MRLRVSMYCKLPVFVCVNVLLVRASVCECVGVLLVFTAHVRVCALVYVRSCECVCFL